MPVEDGVAAPEPLERHRRLILLFVAVVSQDLAEGGVVGGVDPLVVPVDRGELLHDRGDGPVAVDGARREQLGGFVQPFAGHRILPGVACAVRLSISGARRSARRPLDPTSLR